MAHDDTNLLNKRFSVDSLSDSRRLATHITGTDVKLDLAHSTHGPDAEQQLADDLDTATFTFVNTLATDVSTGEFKLPSWPEIVVQIKRALENDECSVEQLVRLIGSEPVLAARLLKVVNSDLHQGGEPIKDLCTAVNRLGVDTVRGIAISLATEQSCHGVDLRPVKPYLAELWQHSVQVAAIAHILAKKYTKISPDEAHLAGLLHDIGKLYVLMRIQDNPVLIDDERALKEIMDAWHTSIGGALIESWKFSEELVSAVRDHELYDLEGVRSPNLTDVVAVANLLANQQTDESADQVDLKKIPACRRLRLHPEISSEVIRASEKEIHVLHQVLGVYTSYDTITAPKLKILDESSLNASVSAGVDPYHTGSFDTSKLRSHK